jgi:hypothetical protein
VGVLPPLVDKPATRNNVEKKLSPEGVASETLRVLLNKRKEVLPGQVRSTIRPEHSVGADHRTPPFGVESVLLAVSAPLSHRRREIHPLRGETAADR